MTWTDIFLLISALPFPPSPSPFPVRRRERARDPPGVPARAQLRAVCHLLRRAGLDLPAPLRPALGHRLQQGGQPAAHRDGRRRGQEGRVRHGRHKQVSRGDN